MKIYNKRILRTLLGVSLAGALAACSNEDLPNRSYTLVWEDNFDGALGASPDSTKWTYDIGTGNNGWGNNELQSYTNRPENVMQDGEGNLVITASVESFGNFTSARIKTQGLFEQAYGRFEARIKTPYGPGIWPAFWMLGNDVDDPEVGWPQAGEIDILELRGQEPSTVHGSLHGPGYSGGTPVTSSYSLTGARFDTDFHVFAVEWGADFIDFYVDDRLYQQVTPSVVPGEWVYDHPFFIILNVAVGGNYVGANTEGTRFPQKMYVDYVRVYKEN